MRAVGGEQLLKHSVMSRSDWLEPSFFFLSFIFIECIGGTLANPFWSVLAGLPSPAHSVGSLSGHF